MSKDQRLVEMGKRAVVLRDKFREILYRNVCMSLFERHKLLFAFFISLKVFERDRSFQAGLDRLTQLPSNKKPSDKLDKSQHDQSKLDNSSRISDTPKEQKPPGSSYHQSQSRVSQPRRPGRGVLSKHDQSDRMTAIDEEREQQILEEQKRLVVDDALLKYCLTGLMIADSEPYLEVNNTRPDLFSEAQWAELHRLSSFPCYETVLEQILQNVGGWEKFMLCEKPEQAFDLMPEPFQSTLAHFAWIPLVRCLKPELTTLAIKRFVAKSLGKFFVTPLIFNLREVYEDSHAHTPLLLILTPGNDPMDQVKKLAEEKQKRVIPVSLGKGQGEKAKQMIAEFRKAAGWIVLQNCHLSKSFLPELELMVEGLQPQTTQMGAGAAQMDFDHSEKKEFTHPEFRIWLTSMSVDYFPQMLLHQSVKLTSEPPKGIKSAMIRSY